MWINNLIIETTRRCQLNCEHCLRGDAEDIDIMNAHITELLKGVNRIYAVTFTGGEPFLNIKAIQHFTSLVEQNNIEIDTFYIATNGILFEDTTPYNSSCLMACMHLFTLCEDKDGCAIDISVDQFHGKHVSDSNYLFALSMTHRKPAHMSYDAIIPEGRGANISSGGRKPPTTEINFEYPDEVQICLNAHGRVTFNCDLSYETQDECSVSIEEAHTIIQKCNHLYLEEVDAYA